METGSREKQRRGQALIPLCLLELDYRGKSSQTSRREKHRDIPVNRETEIERERENKRGEESKRRGRRGEWLIGVNESQTAVAQPGRPWGKRGMKVGLTVVKLWGPHGSPRYLQDSSMS